MENLCTELAKNVNELVKLLPEEGYNLPSAVQGVMVPRSENEAEISKARAQVIEISMRIHRLALGPKGYLPSLAAGVSNLTLRLCFPQAIKRSHTYELTSVITSNAFVGFVILTYLPSSL